MTTAASGSMWEALNGDEHRFRAVLDASRDVIYLFNLRTGRFEYISPSAEEIVGYSADELMALDRDEALALIHPDDREAFFATMARVEGSGTATIEYRQRTRDGGYRWVSHYTSLIPGEDGMPLYRNGSIRDITHRRVTEAALQRESDRLGILADAARRLLSTDDPEQIVQSICERVITHLDCHVFFNYLIEDASGIMRLNAYAGIPAAEAETIRHLAIGTAVCGCVARDGERIITEDIQHSCDGRADLVRSYGVGAYACHPLLYKGATIGTLSFGTKSRTHFSGEDLELMRAIADLVSTAMARKKGEMERAESLAEKEALLSEIHRRVKNNLTAFISLLSLEGSYDNTPAGIAMRTDLQNRARSMALIHETLYKTRRFSRVDMDVYLSTLVSQVAGSYPSRQQVVTIVEAKGITLDLGRATPCGLIVNELVTNALKYAFPADAYAADRDEPCTITITMTKDSPDYLLTIRDNGVGLPAAFDINAKTTLGLRLVNFLARHQMRATVSVEPGPGAGFVFRFPEEGKGAE